MAQPAKEEIRKPELGFPEFSSLKVVAHIHWSLNTPSAISIHMYDEENIVSGKESLENMFGKDIIQTPFREVQ